MILATFQDMVRGIEAKLQEGPQTFMARKKLALEIARMGTRLFGPKLHSPGQSAGSGASSWVVCRKLPRPTTSAR